MNIFKRIGKFFSNIFKRKSKRDEVIIPTQSTVPKSEPVKTVSKPIEPVKIKKDKTESLGSSDRDNIKVEPITSEVIDNERDNNVEPVRIGGFELTPIESEETKTVEREPLDSIYDSTTDESYNKETDDFLHSDGMMDVQRGLYDAISDFTYDESYNKALDVLNESKFIFSVASFIASNRATLVIDGKSFKNMSFKETKYYVITSIAHSREGRLDLTESPEVRTAIKDFANLVRGYYDVESGTYKDVSSDPQYNSMITRVGMAIVSEFGKTRSELMKEKKSYDIDRMGL